MKEEDITYLLKKYSNDSCTEDERQRIEQYILKNSITQHWDWSDEQSKSDTYLKIRERLPMLTKPKPNYKVYAGLGMVATLLITFFIGLFFYKNPADHLPSRYAVIAKAKSYPNNEVTVTLPDGTVRTVAGKINLTEITALKGSTFSQDSVQNWITIKVPYGKAQEIVLSDGSFIALNAGSELRLPQEFTKNHRQVYIQGEGYFDIKKDPLRPFTVMAGIGKVEVTGTAFNIQAYTDQKEIRTSLVEGSVNFYLHNAKHTIQPGFEIVADLTGAPIQYKKFDVNQLTSWKDGYFTFEKKSLTDVMKIVSRWYNITILTDINLDHMYIGGTYPTGLSLQELLEDLSTLSGLKFTHKGKEVRFYK